jgi:hypothetical protein
MKYNVYTTIYKGAVTASLYVKAKPDTNKKNKTITYGIVHRANKLAMCLIKFITC